MSNSSLGKSDSGIGQIAIEGQLPTLKKLPVGRKGVGDSTLQTGEIEQIRKKVTKNVTSSSLETSVSARISFISTMLEMRVSMSCRSRAISLIRDSPTTSNAFLSRHARL